MIIKNIKQIINELTLISNIFKEKNIKKLINDIQTSKSIVCCGAGRMGYVSKSFAMRLSHLGFNSYYYEDSNVPNLSKKDLVIFASGSGETKTIVNLALIASKNNIKIALITSNPKSSLGKLANTIIDIKTPHKLSTNHPVISVQPMTSLTEQFLYIFYDALILELIQYLKKDKSNFWLKHSNLE